MTLAYTPEDVQEGKDAWGHLYTCPGCGKQLRSLEHDGYCRSCGGPEIEYVPNREAFRRLHMDTAAFLRRKGHEAEARFFDEMAQKEG